MDVQSAVIEQSHMEEEEEEEVWVVVNEEGAEKLVQRFHLRRLWPEGLHRHCVATWLNCCCLSKPLPDVTFNSVLKWLFLTTLGLSLLNTFLGLLLPKEYSTWNVTLDPTWLFMPLEAGRRGVTLLTIFVAAVCVRAFVKKLKKTTGSASWRKEEVQTISASIRPV